MGIHPNGRGNPAPIPRKTKVAVIREEYVSITDRFEQALVLNQFVYWTERVNDFDQFIIEENKRKELHGLQEEMEEPTHGWIYKTASQLSGELMTKWSDNTTRKHIKALTQKGYLEERQNPKYKWTQTKQYRVNLNLVQMVLFEKGYSIPGFTVPNQAISNNIVKENNQLQNLQLEVQSEQVPIANSEIQDANFAIVPIIETINKETTTTSLPSSSQNEFLKTIAVLFAMIPQQYQKNSTKKIIERGLQSRGEAFVRSAIAYTVAKSTGGTWDKFNSFLGKCIDEGWAEDYEPDTDQANDKEEKAKLFLASRRKLPDDHLKMDAMNGCKVSMQVLKERGIQLE